MIRMCTMSRGSRPTRWETARHGGVLKQGGEAALKHWATQEEFLSSDWHKSKIRGSSAGRWERNLVELTAHSRVFREEAKTRDRAIILEIWRVKIKLPDNKQSEMNQFWKYMLMLCGADRQRGLSVIPQMTRYQTTGFLEILDGTVRQADCLPHFIYAPIRLRAALGLLLAAGASRWMWETNKESRFLLDVISQSFLIVSIAMHFHGSVILPWAICLRVSFLPERLDTQLSIAFSEWSAQKPIICFNNVTHRHILSAWFPLIAILRDIVNIHCSNNRVFEAWLVRNWVI